MHKYAYQAILTIHSDTATSKRDIIALSNKVDTLVEKMTKVETMVEEFINKVNARFEVLLDVLGSSKR